MTSDPDETPVSADPTSFGLYSHQKAEDGQGKYVVLGKLNAAWNTLDYILRLALKRKRGVSINSPDADKIFNERHNCLIKYLSSEYEGQQDVLDEIQKVGKKRDGNEYYGRRNKYFHAVWAVDRKGQDIHQRVGGNDWRNPITFSNEDIEQLINDIEQTAFKIEALTKNR